MKKLFPTLLMFWLTGALYAQHRVQITVENATNFQGVTPVFLRVQANDGTHIFRSGKPVFTLNLQGDVAITVAAPGFEPVYGQYHIDKDMDLGFLLDVPQRTLDTRPDLLMDALVQNATTLGPVPSGRVRITVGKQSWQFPFANGRFVLTRARWQQIFSKIDPFTNIDYEISAPGYRTLHISDRVPTAYTVKAFRLEPVHTPPVSQARPAANIPADVQNLFRSVDSRLARRPSTTTSCDRMPGWIRVGVNCSCNDCSSVRTMGLETYVRQGLNDEWIASWDAESLKAGSLPYRTYGAYYVYHPIRSNYDISSTTCKQVWDSDYANSCVSAAQDTQGQYVETPGGAVAFSEYSAENNCLNSSACSCGNGYSGNGSDWPCIYDPVCAGHDRYGHGRGMCQWGSQRWASQRNKDYMWINDHYYNPGNIFRCGTDHGHPDLGMTNGSISSQNLTVNQNFSVSFTVENNSSYRSDKNRAAAYLSTDNQFDTSDTELGDVTLWPIDAGGSSDKTLNLQVPNVSGGNYYVLVVADPDGEMYETDETNNTLAFAVTVSTTAVGTSQLEGLVDIFPNPVHRTLTVRVHNGAVLQTMFLTNRLGQEVMHFGAGERRLDLSQLSAGVYFLHVYLTDGRQGVFRVMKD